MKEDDIKNLIVRGFRKKRYLAFAMVVCSIILVNTPADNMGYWIFGAALTWIGFLTRMIQIAEETVLICVRGADSVSENHKLTAEGLEIHVSANLVEDLPGSRDYSRVKGSLFIFRKEV